MLFLRNYRLNREPLLGLFFPSNAEVQKKRDIQNNTAKKICTLSPNFEKIAGKPAQIIIRREIRKHSSSTSKNLSMTKAIQNRQNKLQYELHARKLVLSSNIKNI